MLDTALDLGVRTISLPTPFPVGPVNAFLLKRDPPILIDTGLRTEETYDRLKEALKEEGYSFADLGAIIATHAHRDHIGLLGRIQEETAAPAYAHVTVEADRLDAVDDATLRRQFFLDIMAQFGVPGDIMDEANSLYDKFRTFSGPYKVEHPVEDGDEILGFRVYHVPGHSPSDTLFVDATAGLSFTGDHVLQGTNPNPLLRRPKRGQPRAKSLVEYRQSLRRTRELKLGICCPGHGEPFGDHVTVVDRILSRQGIRASQVLNSIRAGKRTPYSISRRLFPELALPHLHLGLSIAIGHMEVLEEQGVLDIDDASGVVEARLR